MEQKGYRNSREKALYTMVSLYMTHPVYSSSIITYNDTKDKSNKSILILRKPDKQMSGSLNLTLQFKWPHIANGYYISTVLDKGISKVVEKSKSKNILISKEHTDKANQRTYLNNPLNNTRN